MTSHISRPVDMPVASDIMTRNVTTFPPDMGLEDAWKRLSKLGFSGVVVVENEAVVGVLSESDVVRSLAGAVFADQPVGQVRDAMQSQVTAISPTTDLFAMVDRMRNEGIRRLPVCDGTELVGILTLKDLDKALMSLVQQRNTEVKDRRPQGAAWDPEESRKRDKQ